MFARRFTAIAATVLMGSVASAGDEPGSLMVFPMFNNQEGFITLLTVTNTSRTTPAKVRFVYHNGYDCQKFDRFEHLTPLDTFTCTVRAHNPNHDSKGYITVFALSPDSFDEPIAFNHLVGTSLIIDGLAGGSYALNPFMFKGISDGDVNGNGRRDLDGIEYSTAPASIIIPRFLGQADGLSATRLILIEGTRGLNWPCNVDFVVFNDNEEPFTANYTFRCWEEVGLLDVSNLFSNNFLKSTNHDPYEIRGYPDAESGWFYMTGRTLISGTGVIPRPVILAVLIEPTIGVQAAAAPFQTGERLNGSFH